MQVPFIKYIETLVIGKMSLQEIEDKLAKIGRQFPSKGLSIIYQRFLKEQEGYFKGNDEMDPVWLADWQVEKMYGYEFNKEVAPGTEGIQGAF